MSTDLTASFNEKYMNINSKLKKRFMRKPNINEATNEFVALAHECENAEQPQFAAQAYVGAAKCEAAMGSFIGEADFHVRAARHYMKAEKKLASLKFDRPVRENLEAAIGCFLYAISKYPSDSPLRISLLLELGNHLISLDHKAEALMYFEKALELVDDESMRLMCHTDLLDLLIDCGKFDVAYDNANKIYDSGLSIPEDIIIEVQVTRILLTLLLEPPEECRPASLKELMTELMSDNEYEKFPVSRDVRLKLQSACSAARAPDAAAIVRAARDLRYQVTVRQARLLDLLSKRMRDTYLIVA